MRRVRSLRRLICGTLLAGVLVGVTSAPAVAGPEETLSPITAVPAGKIAIDGDQAEWDFTGSQIAYVAADFFAQERGEHVFAYDATALYVAMRVADTTPLRNIYHAAERFWEGDSLELRLYSKLKDNQHVPNRTQKLKSNQVVHLSFFRQHTAGGNWTFLAYGAEFYESKIDPPGVETAFREAADKAGYTFEAKIPWSVLNVPVPPQPGDSMRVLLGFNFGNATGDRRMRSAPGAYRCHPGDFGFQNTDSWGYLQFAAGPLTKREWPDAAELQAANQKPQEGQAISLELPRAGLVTVNLYDAGSGQLVRELVDDRVLPRGTQTLVWDGKDNAGQDAPLGEYAWKALLHQKIGAKYVGSVGSSGSPPYQNDAGTGEWGGDISYPLSVAVDPQGMTILWPGTDGQGRCVVRLDPDGKTRWRYTPFFDAAGNIQALAADGEYIYLTYETPDTPPAVLRLSAATGEPKFFAKDMKSVPLPLPLGTARVKTSAVSRPVAFDLIATGLAVDAQNLYVAVFAANEVLVLNKADAAIRKRVAVPGPRGVAMAKDGSLLVTSYVGESGRVYRIDPASGKSRDLVTKGLNAPWGIAVRGNGNFLVTDLGSSQQVKEFTAEGRPVRAYGKPGGRPYAGSYHAGDFLCPAGIAGDAEGGFVVAEAAIPGVVTRIDRNGKVARQWFGPGDYSSRVWPDPEDPFTLYSTTSNGFTRSVLNPRTGAWRLNACWATADGYAARENPRNLAQYAFPEPACQDFMDSISYPQSVRLGGASYLSSDSAKHPIVRIAGDDFVPVAAAEARDGHLWIAQETSGNGRFEASEWQMVPDISLPVTSKGKPGILNNHVGSQTLSPYTGNWYLVADRVIYRVPCAGFAKGKLRFDAAATKVVVADVTDGYKGNLYSSYRWGVLGVREDAGANLYVVYTYQGKSPGIGHSSDITRAFVAKFDSQGRRLWVAGRKAPSFAKPGEMYDPWVMAGLLGDRAVAISDEGGGMIHFYSADGFYLGRIFEDVGRGDGQPGPYLFNGENFSGRVQEFPRNGKNRYMAYMGETDSRVFVLDGLEAPRALLTGTVTLSRHYGTRRDTAETASLVRVAALPAIDGSMANWEPAAPLTIRSGGSELASVRLALNGKNLYFRFDVKDATPLANAEPDPKIAFKGGDAVDLYFGPAGERRDPVLGDVRLLVSLHEGKATLVGMKPKAEGVRSPQLYTNPGGHKREFDFVGAVDGAVAAALTTADGYAVAGRVPLAFLKPLVFAPGTELRFDADVLGSDPSGRRTMTRSFWHAAGDSALTMTQDMPTEAWLYPAYWGQAVVK